MGAGKIRTGSAGGRACNAATSLGRTLGAGLLTLVLGGCAASPPHPAANGAQVIDVARAELGTPYRYGGASPQRGFDCSGLVYYSFRHAGYSVPRTVLGQYRASEPVLGRDLRPGDLVFFRTLRKRVSHVGIYLGDGRFLHAPSSGSKVRIGTLDSDYWRAKFIRGGRF